MHGQGRLQGGLVRLFADHRAPLARAYRIEYETLRAGLALDGDPILQREAARVAFLIVRAQDTARGWTALVEKRRTGRGRRPSPREVERAARRAALDDQTATQALDRLRELAGRNGRHGGPSLEEMAALLDRRLRRPHV